MSRSLWAVLAVVMLACLAALPAAAAASPPVYTAEGPVAGTDFPGYRSFLGIPYAAPPVGSLRWRAPQSVTPWTTVRDATVAGNRCPQMPDGSGYGGSENEDCLTVNVFTPDSATPAHRKPVMVWLHGGGDTGSANDYDARRLAVQGDVVVVTVNYRLGIFGFFSHPTLPNGGTFGLLDQQAALRWVQRNAAAFNGDPTNVTLFGESSGGVDSCLQLVSPLSAGLYQRMIQQSGSCTTFYQGEIYYPGQTGTYQWESLSAANADGAITARALGCNSSATAVACLRGKPVSDLLQAIFSLPLSSPGYVPAYGTSALPQSPVQALASGAFQRVPVMSGSTLDEGRTFGPDISTMTEQQYLDKLSAAFGANAAAVAAQYPASAYPRPGLAWAQTITDRTFSLGTLQANRAISRYVRVYGFEFADRNAPFIGGVDLGYPTGAYHGSDVPYLFDLVGLPLTFTTEQQTLQQQMIGYWSRFAKTGNPNDGTLPSWSYYDSAASVPAMQGLNTASGGGIRAVDFNAEHKLAFWTRLLG